MFDFIANPADAQINCEWTNNLKERGNSFEAGHCDTIRSGSLRTEKQRPLIFVGSNLTETDTSFYNICVHEIGHALGLMHSSNPQDVMYSMGGPQDAHQFACLLYTSIARQFLLLDECARDAVQIKSLGNGEISCFFPPCYYIGHDSPNNSLPLTRIVRLKD